MKSVVITGVAGLLGSRLAKWIVENKPEYKVIGIDNLSGGYEEHIDSRVIFYKADLASDDLNGIFSSHQVEYVYHFSAYAAEGLSPFIRRYNYTNNVVATANVINACITHDVKRIVFTSSMAVYGEGKPPFNENDLPKPVDPYGIAKYACEMDVQVAGEQHGLDWCIIRPHNVYGCNQNIWDRYRNVLGIWIYQKLNDQPITIYGDGSQKRSFSYIDDSLLPLWAASQNDACIGEIINLGGIKEISIVEAYQVLANVTKTNVAARFLEPRHEAKYAWSTWNKSKDLLSFEHKIELEEGLTKMWDWAQRQPMKTRKLWTNYEIENGLYEYWKK